MTRFALPARYSVVLAAAFTPGTCSIMSSTEQRVLSGAAAVGYLVD